jgi:hypothetical protein
MKCKDEQLRILKQTMILFVKKHLQTQYLVTQHPQPI